MYQIEDKEYKLINYFNDELKFTANSDLLKQKRNLMIAASIILFYFLAGIKIEAVSIGLIKGNITNLWVIPASLISIFIYRFILFFVQFKKQLKEHSFNQYSKESYSKKLVLYIINKKLKSITSHPNLIEGVSFNKNLKSYDFQMMDIQIPREKLINLDHFTVENTAESRVYNVSFKYTLSQNDLVIYNRNYHLLKYTFSHQFLHYVFPLIYSFLALLAIIFHYQAFMIGLI